MIAALFVATGGAYFGLPGVDPWDEKRDARLYSGPHPVVAHPPCSTWCQLAALNQSLYGHRIGDDAGCFASALESVQTWGGVLEHPAETIAWSRFGLARPLRGGWSRSGDGWTAVVEQGHYGHRARKSTWLYVCHIDPANLPRLPYGRSIARATVSGCRNHGGGDLPRLGPREAKASPPAFRDMLLDLARSAQNATARRAHAGQAIGPRSR